MEDKLELVAGRQAVAILPADAADMYTRPDLSNVALLDVAPGQVVLATRAEDRTELAAALRAAARTHLIRQQFPG